MGHLAPCPMTDSPLVVAVSSTGYQPSEVVVLCRCSTPAPAGCLGPVYSGTHPGRFFSKHLMHSDEPGRAKHYILSVWTTSRRWQRQYPLLIGPTIGALEYSHHDISMSFTTASKLQTAISCTDASTYITVLPSLR